MNGPLPSLLLAAALAGCKSKYSDGGEKGESGGGDDSEPVEQVSGTLTFIDSLSKAGIPGVSVTDGTSTWTSDSAGAVQLTLPPDDNIALEATATDYVTTWEALSTDRESGWTLTEAMIAPRGLEAIAAMVGTTYDSGDGVLMAHVLVQNTKTQAWIGLPGATVDIDGSYDAAVVQDPAGKTPFSTNNTIATGGGSYVMFLNAQVGATNVTVSPPGGESCTTLPSSETFDDVVDLYSGAITVVRYGCVSSAE